MATPHAPHRDTFFDNFEEVERLLEIHTQISGTGPGYKHNVEVLNKSALILLVATWESFIEELANNAFDFLIANSDTPAKVPNTILALSSKVLKTSPNEMDIWKLAEKGWKDVLGAHRDAVIKKYVKSLNTPRTENIDEIFKCLLGINKMSSNWYWGGMSVSKSRMKLEKLITTRGEIAHTVKAPASITKSKVMDYMGFLNRLATLCNNRCAEHLHDLVGKKPWKTYHYGSSR